MHEVIDASLKNGVDFIRKFGICDDTLCAAVVLHAFESFRIIHLDRIKVRKHRADIWGLCIPMAGCVVIPCNIIAGIKRFRCPENHSVTAVTILLELILQSLDCFAGDVIEHIPVKGLDLLPQFHRPGKRRVRMQIHIPLWEYITSDW